MQTFSFNHRSFFSKFPVMKFDKCSIRELMLKDTADYLSLMNDEQVRRYNSDEDVPQTLADAERDIKFWSGLFHRGLSIFWAIADNETDQLIGSIGFNNWNFHNCRGEISYDLHQAYRRQGIMQEVLYNILKFGIEKMLLKRIEARTMLGNEPSIKLLEKSGFKLEGISRNYRIIRKEPTDITIYSFIPEDFVRREDTAK